MKPTMNMTTIRLSVSKGFSAGTLWRVARVVAVGALLATSTALYFNMAAGSQAGSPSSIEKMEVAPKFTDLDAVDNYLSVDDLRKYVYPEEPGQARDDAASPSSYWVQRDEAEEMTYDELSKNFIGIPSPSTKITGRFLSGEDLRFMIHYWGRFLSDEDLRFMIQYLNELKEDEVTNSVLNDVRQIK
jgi:hypothetical protein